MMMLTLSNSILLGVHRRGIFENEFDAPKCVILSGVVKFLVTTALKTLILVENMLLANFLIMKNVRLGK